MNKKKKKKNLRAPRINFRKKKYEKQRFFFFWPYLFSESEGARLKWTSFTQNSHWRRGLACLNEVTKLTVYEVLLQTLKCSVQCDVVFRTVRLNAPYRAT